jgi:oligopeptide transport system ATP-binding protein
MHLMEVKQLAVQFQTTRRSVSAVNGIGFTLDRGKTLGIVGESGSGKSQSVLAMMGLLAPTGAPLGQVLYHGKT